ncbi:hypothetical protein CRG98_001458 [Punica granatum]|uniref:Myb/SANT-like domain-containing protein n=1 Tax=Punica granatum TaxID=22663 RepID=A0A2I0LBS1_PUNGR|nr:hypothetical protein CRG98_001458 [Punica granatum]
MAPKGEGIVEWTDELESAFVDIMVDKFQRTHTSSWKLKDWEWISSELEEKFSEGYGDSDEPTHEAEEPIVTGSRWRVRKRGSNNKSQLQELIDLYKESKVNKDKLKNSTPPESKKSKSVTSPEKPAHNNIAEAMVVLNQMKGTIFVREYLVGTARITEDDRWRQAFVCMYDEARREWLHSLVHP